MPPEKRRLRHIYTELVGHPFFPILFIAEAVKTAIGGGPVLEFGALAIGATLLWVFSDAVDVDVDTDSIV